MLFDHMTKKKKNIPHLYPTDVERKKSLIREGKEEFGIKKLKNTKASKLSKLNRIKVKREERP